MCFVFCVTELEDGFAIDDSNVEVYATQKVELSCKASYYGFKYLRWKRKDPVTNATVFVIDPGAKLPPNPRVEINDEDTDRYSLWSRVSIDSANISDSGLYKCVGKLIYGARITREMVLKVKGNGISLNL